MKLEVVTPTSLAVHEDDVSVVRAEDASGRFAVMTGHAELVTALAVSVLSWRRRDGGEGHCAVRGGILTVRAGARVDVATQQAVVSDDLERLEHAVTETLRTEEEEARDARIHARQLHVAALQKLMRYARPGAPADAPGAAVPGREFVDGGG